MFLTFVGTLRPPAPAAPVPLPPGLAPALGPPGVRAPAIIAPLPPRVAALLLGRLLLPVGDVRPIPLSLPLPLLVSLPLPVPVLQGVSPGASVGPLPGVLGVPVFAGVPGAVPLVASLPALAAFPRLAVLAGLPGRALLRFVIPLVAADVLVPLSAALWSQKGEGGPQNSLRRGEVNTEQTRVHTSTPVAYRLCARVCVPGWPGSSPRGPSPAPGSCGGREIGRAHV